MKQYKEFNKQEFDRWIHDKGDSTLRLDYNLNEDSLVIDAGGFEGKWAEKIYNKYKCKIFVFEPIKKYFDLISDKFKDNDRVVVYNFGLSGSDEEVDIFHSGDGSSVFLENGESERIKIIGLSKFMEENKIEHVDLIKVNIEGSEFDLLEDLIEKNMINMFNDIQVQFHRFIPDCDIRRNKIREELKKTHNITYDYEFIWENWSLNK